MNPTLRVISYAVFMLWLTNSVSMAQSTDGNLPPWLRNQEAKYQLPSTPAYNPSLIPLPPITKPPPPLPSIQSPPPWKTGTKPQVTSGSQTTSTPQMQSMIPALPAGYPTTSQNNANTFYIPEAQPPQIPVTSPPSPTLEVLPLPNTSMGKDLSNLEIKDSLSKDLSAGEEIVIMEEQSQSPHSYWRWPLTFIRGEDWSNSAELGINGTDGNSESMSLLTGIVLNRKTKRDLNDFKITAQKTNTNGIETQNNALMYYNYEYFIGESAWSLFVKSGFEYDEFKAFDSRLFINSGLAYKFIRTKALTTGTRFGLGTSREFGGPDDRWVPELLFGLDYDHQINSRNKVILKVDYFPDITDFNNYRVISDASWEYLLNSDGNLSLKLSAVDRYDSTPNGRKPNDVNYGVLLLYKF